MAHTVIFDTVHPRVVHTRIDCPAHVGLVEAVEQHTGAPADDPAAVERAAQELGLMVPAHLVPRGTPCTACTLVAAPLWRAAA